jgi:hypothetical protein
MNDNISMQGDEARTGHRRSFRELGSLRRLSGSRGRAAVLWSTILVVGYLLSLGVGVLMGDGLADAISDPGTYVVFIILAATFAVEELLRQKRERGDSE